MDRLVVVARLIPGSAAKAAQLIDQGPPFEPEETGFTRHSVYLSEGEAVFLFEGPGVEWLVDEIVDDPVRSAAFSAWAPLLEGSPRLALERYHWERRSP